RYMHRRKWPQSKVSLEFPSLEPICDTASMRTASHQASRQPLPFHPCAHHLRLLTQRRKKFPKQLARSFSLNFSILTSFSEGGES
ncbi:hypothetical protein H0H93_000554, partial [Arthromyces matolae]